MRRVKFPDRKEIIADLYDRFGSETDQREKEVVLGLL